MPHSHFRNVNTAFIGMVKRIKERQFNDDLFVETESRNGPVIAFQEPVTITYEKPLERILLNKYRDQNCFFTLMEAIWMLSGSNLVKPLAYFTPNMMNYSDDGVTLNGAYGYRWREANPKTEEVETGIGMLPEYSTVDQLNLLIEHLRTTPNSRRAVLQMWNVEDDLLKVDTTKDNCCNICVSFHTREDKSVCGRKHMDPNCVCANEWHIPIRYLDMTVFNRSNDMIWGALGANQVHFSFLQQYIAECCDLAVGVYNHISSNMHVYLNNWKPEEWLKDNEHSECYPELTKLPLVKDKEQFDKECKKIVEMVSRGQDNIHKLVLELQEPYLDRVVMPMVMAFKQHKYRIYDEAYKWMELVEAPDWRRAGTEWLERREDNWKAKQEKSMNQ